MNILRLGLIWALTISIASISAQSSEFESIAIEFMKQSAVDEGFEPLDFADFEIIHSFQSAHNGVTHYYIVQRYQGIEVEHAIVNINVLPNGEVLHHSNKGVRNIATKVTPISNTVSCHDAFGICLSDLGLSTKSIQTAYQKSNEVRFEKSEGLFDDVIARKLWSRQPDGNYRMVWDMNVLTTHTQEAINYQVDVASGQILRNQDITIKCQFDHEDHDNQCSTSIIKTDRVIQSKRPSFPIKKFNTIADNAVYNVFPIPGESPNHINRSMIINPADPVASPLGWHDVDGISGADSTNTSGNNVWAVADYEGDDVGDGNEPEGGNSLVFDFPVDLNAEPKAYTDAAIVNLFYMNNIVHDVAYRYGFDEAAGNFQQFNYTGQGVGGDLVQAFGQSSIDKEPGTSSRNNANFSPAAEGFRGRMRMYVWERGVAGSDLLEVLAPSNIAGTKMRGHGAGFGPTLPANGITGNVVIGDDGTPRGCNPLNNASEINGNIAMIDRGECNFDLKVQNAREAGAIAVIICNFEEETFRMGGTVDSGIPAVMIGNQDCQVLKAGISSGLQVQLKIPPLTGPDQVDGTLDNGIVAHEYGHGISTRLVGGAQRAGCLSNDQQMGEGWSDFFTLILSVEDGDTGATPRGIGTFVERDNVDGLGIRRFPYSTDMSINPQTFGDIVLTGSSPHNLGTVWCSMIWDLYWALAERDGFDPDVYEGDGGNNTAIRLVMDGMKMLACSPSFIDARDAILAADIANNGGVNQGLIWEVFARRGLGLSAIAGSGADRKDAREAFDVPGEFDPGLKINKTMTELINPGDEITVTISIKNDKPTSTNNTIVTDIVPANASYITNSASQTVTQNGDQLIFDLGTMNPTQTKTITYKLNTADDIVSDLLWYDGVESTTGKWIEDVVEGVKGWKATSALAKEGDQSFYIESDTIVTDRSLRNTTPVNLNNTSFPVLRFYQNIQTESGFDVGIVQLSRDGGATWEDAGDRIFKYGYTGKIPYQPFALSNQKGYFGTTGGFEETYVDLRDYIGDDVHFRFRYGSNEEEVVDGWYIDEVAIMDLKTYQSEVCVTSSQGDNECTEAPFYGAAINYDLALDVEDQELAESAIIYLHPNPTRDWINITITGERINQPVNYKLLNISGKNMSSGQLSLSNGTVQDAIDVRELPKGMYFVNIIVGGAQISKRFIKQ